MKKKIFFLLLVTIILLTATGCFFIGDETNSNALDLSKTNIKLATTKYNYTGNAICPDFKIYQNNNVILDFSNKKQYEDLKVTYENNINVGRATIKVEPNADSKNYKGSVSGYFVIQPVKQIAQDASSLIKYLQDSNNQNISLGQDIVIPNDATVLLQTNATLNTNGYTLTNNGSVTIKGTLNITNAKNKIAKVVNTGNFNFNNVEKPTTLNAEQNTLFINKGNLTMSSDRLNGNRHSSAYLLSDNPIFNDKGEKLFVKKDSSSYFFVRRPLTEFEINVSNDNEYTGEKIYPSISIRNTEAEGIYYLVNNCDVTYINNINAGTATIKITAKEFSKYFTGEITKEFIINKTNITIDESKYNLLNEALTNENYYAVTLFGNYPNEITVPKNATLIIKGNNNIKSIVNNGTLKIFNTNVDEALLINKLTNNGLLEITGDKLVANLVIDGDGQVKLNSDLFLSDNGNISNVKLTSNHNIYYNNSAQVLGVNLPSEQLIKREKFVTNTNLRIDNNHLEYNKQKRNMLFTFIKDASDLQCANDSFILTIPTNMINAGGYPFTIEFLPLSKYFYGTDNGNFFIDKTSITLNSDDDIGKILDSNNYDNISLEYPTFVPTNKQYVVPNDTTITIGTNATLYNNSLVENGLIKSCLVLLGKIVNNGIYCEIGERNISLRPELDEDNEGANIGIIENNGKAYFNKVTEENKKRIRKYGNGYPILSNGTSFVRTAINDCNMTVLSNECTFNKKDGVYDKENLIPNLTLSLDGTTLTKTNDLLNENSDFVVIGVNNNHITSKFNETYANITACYTSEKVFGTRKIDYTIKPGTINVANFNELKNALNDSANYHNYSDYICDWKEIIVTEDIQYNGAYNMVLIVPSNVNLRAGTHSINLYSTEKDIYYHPFVCQMNNYGNIYTSCKTYNFDMEYHAKDNGKTIGEAYNLEDFKSYLRYDEIYLMTDLTTDKDNKYIKIKTNGNEDYHGNHMFTIYLNGHTINKLLINCEGRSVCVNGDNSSTVTSLYLEGMRNDIEYGKNPKSILLNNFNVDLLTYDTSYEEKYTVKNNMTITSERVDYVINIP